MQIADKYSPREIESKWYDYWTGHRLFHSEPDQREPYTIVIPPPNVTGMLHMGHMLNNTLQDVLVRRARMSGRNACWVPGTDHASIATEAKVVAMLRERGHREVAAHARRVPPLRLGVEGEVRRRDPQAAAPAGRLVRLGAHVLHDGRDAQPRASSSVFCRPLQQREDLPRRADGELGPRGADGPLGRGGGLSRSRTASSTTCATRSRARTGRSVVATTRPETILGDTALCVNPDDPRYAWLPADARVVVPLVGRSIPVIRDEYVDIEFGTGALKVTPAHDVNDYMLGEKYGLETIDIFNDDGTINDKVGHVRGSGPLRRAQADREGPRRRRGCSKRPRSTPTTWATPSARAWPSNRNSRCSGSSRWSELAGPATKAVMEDAIRFVPEKYKNTYRHWMENIKDWCISRQLWWGQRIPAYYLSEGRLSWWPRRPRRRWRRPARRRGDASLQAADLRQDEDVLDTWFSSWLWPISVFDGIRNPGNREIRYYYPTDDLVTGPDIIFFWVARMIMAGYEYRQEKPFENVYFTGIVRDKIGRKMSKQLGNSPDPLDLIARYGADGVRMAMLISSSAGNDVMFDEALCEQGRNFGNKIWNAYRLVNGWTTDAAAAQSENDRLAVEWFDQAMGRSLRQIAEDFRSYRISEAFKEAYRLFWDDFSGLYLETVKPAYGQPTDPRTMEATKGYFDALMRLLHPFMPFVTEEIWQALAPRAEGESICVAPMPEPCAERPETLARFELAKEVVSAVRNIRNQKNLPQKEALALHVIADGNYPAEYAPVMRKLANLSAIETVAEKDPAAAAFLVKTTQYFVPMEGRIDAEAERAKLRRDLEYYEGFLASVMKKLSNERFVQSAPEKVVANERAKQADAEAKIAAIREQLEALA